MASVALHQGCTTYFTDIGLVPEIFLKGKWGLQWGSGGCAPVGSRGKAPGQGVRRLCPPEADDNLLIQQQNFCTHSYVYAEIQLQLSRPGLF